MSIYTAIPLINTGDGNFTGYVPAHAATLATDESLHLRVKAVSDAHALGEVFTVGNRAGCDIFGREWPADVRSLSVGDVVVLRTDGDTDSGRAYACAAVGWERRHDLDHDWSDCLSRDRMVLAGHARLDGTLPTT